MRAVEFLKEQESNPAWDWIKKVYDQYPRNPLNSRQFVMVYGQGEDQQLAMFELEPSLSKKNAVEVKWFQSYPHRQGVGTRAMKELQSLAAKDGISLTLYPWDKGQVSQRNLTKFYRGVGYTPINKGGKSMSWSPDNITESTNTNILVVDVQPAYDAWSGAVVGGVAQMLNRAQSGIYVLYNAEEQTADDYVDVINYMIEGGLDEGVADRINYFSKEYGFFRPWMDQGVPDRIIIKTVRAMVQNRVNDSRMLDINAVLTPEEQQEFQSHFKYSDWEDEGIYMPDFMPISILKQISPFYMCGGGRNECLREIELLCNAFNIRYKRIDQLIYG